MEESDPDRSLPTTARIVDGPGSINGLYPLSPYWSPRSIASPYPMVVLLSAVFPLLLVVCEVRGVCGI